MSSAIFKSPLPYIALLICHVIWGGNFVVAKLTLQEFPPNSLAFLRFAFAVVLLIPFFIIQTKKVKLDLKDLPKLIIIGLLIISLNISFFFEGITKTTVINAAVLTLAVPILSVLAGWIFLKEKVYFVNLLGILIALIGSIIVIQIPQFFIGSFSPAEVVGNILLLLASLSWVIGSLISREMLKKYPSLFVTTIAFLVGIVTFAYPAFHEYQQNPGWVNNVSMLGILGLIYMIFLSSISAYFLFEWGLSKVGVGQANIMQYIEPFIATGLAVMILGEKITVPVITGGILIIAGVFLTTLAKEFHHKAQKIHRF